MSNASPSNSLVASYSPTNSVSIQSTSYLNPPVSNIVPNGSLSPPSSFSSYSTIPGSAATSTARSTSISYKRELPPATSATNAYSQSFSRFCGVSRKAKSSSMAFDTSFKPNSHPNVMESREDTPLLPESIPSSKVNFAVISDRRAIASVEDELSPERHHGFCNFVSQASRFVSTLVCESGSESPVTVPDEIMIPFPDEDENTFSLLQMIDVQLIWRI